MAAATDDPDEAPPWKELQEEPLVRHAMLTDIFGSSVRSAGDLAGVFEFDRETGYFYLYEAAKDSDNKIVDSIHITSQEPDFGQEDVVVRWDLTESKVGLFIRGVLWAMFDTACSRKYGGNYKTGMTPFLPEKLLVGF